MAKAELNPIISEVLGTLGKRKKRAYPLHRLDLTIQTYPHSTKLNKKPKPTNKKSKYQRMQRERFKEADCIYFRLTKEERIQIWRWANATGKTTKEGLTSYDAFMQAMLKNYCPDLLQDYFCTDLAEPTAEIQETTVKVSTSIIYNPSLEDFEGWFERIMRRT